VATIPHEGATASPAGTRRQELLDIAARLFAEKGIVHTTVRDIAERAGILSGSLYHHFDSKDQIVTEVVATGLRQAGERDASIIAAAPDPAVAMARLVTNFVVWVGNEPEVARILVSDQQYLTEAPDLVEVRDCRAANGRRWREVIGAGIDDGLFRSDIDPAVVVRAIFDGSLAAVRWLPPMGVSDPADVGRELARFYLSGLLEGGLSAVRLDDLYSR
jgi:AcrR family transcriptional regulator